MGSRPPGGGWYSRRRATDPLVAWATVVDLAVAAFFFGLLLVGAADPSPSCWLGADHRMYASRRRPLGG